MSLKYMKDKAVQESLVMSGVALFAVLGVLNGIPAVVAYVRNKNKKGMDIFKDSINISSNEIEVYINELMEKYPMVKIDQNVYNQFIAFKKSWLLDITNLERIIAQERISPKEENYDKVLKPLEIKYKFDEQGNVVNSKDINAAILVAEMLIKKYKLPDKVQLKYMDSHDEFSSGNSYQIAYLPIYKPNKKDVVVPIDDIIGVLVQKQILKKFDTSAKECVEIDEYDGFHYELFCDLYESSDIPDSIATEDVDKLFREHPYIRVFETLLERIHIKNLYSSVLREYLQQVSKVSKYMKPTKDMIQESVFDIAAKSLQ